MALLAMSANGMAANHNDQSAFGNGTTQACWMLGSALCAIHQASDYPSDLFFRFSYSGMSSPCRSAHALTSENNQRGLRGEKYFGLGNSLMLAIHTCED